MHACRTKHHIIRKASRLKSGAGGMLARGRTQARKALALRPGQQEQRLLNRRAAQHEQVADALQLAAALRGRLARAVVRALQRQRRHVLHAYRRQAGAMRRASSSSATNARPSMSKLLPRAGSTSLRVSPLTACGAGGARACATSGAPRFRRRSCVKSPVPARCSTHARSEARPAPALGTSRRARAVRLSGGSAS